MALCLPGVFEFHLTIKGAFLPIDLGIHNSGFDDALETVEFGANIENVVAVCALCVLQRNFCIDLAGAKSGAEKYALGNLLSQ
jgi:hypothetical protein